jgi:hypothetical protein
MALPVQESLWKYVNNFKHDYFDKLKILPKFDSFQLRWDFSYINTFLRWN